MAGKDVAGWGVDAKHQRMSRIDITCLLNLRSTILSLEDIIHDRIWFQLRVPPCLCRVKYIVISQVSSIISKNRPET